jgi:hypothetical protein
MPRRLLINLTDYSDFKQMSQTAFNSTIDQFTNDAQEHDVQELLGRDFYNDLLRNYDSTEYQALLNPGDYVFESTTYYNVGLKSVIVHYGYARYKFLGSNQDTPFGTVVKHSESSSPSSDVTLKNIWKENRNMAYTYWENVKEFLDRNSDDYPLYESQCRTNKNRFRISRIG